jgi:hypothetical protein
LDDGDHRVKIKTNFSDFICIFIYYPLYMMASFFFRSNENFYKFSIVPKQSQTSGKLISLDLGYNVS